MDTYFKKYENAQPPAPVPHSPLREALFQFVATLTIVVGAWYIVWRWGWSLNPDALWFAIPVIAAETAAYIGLVLFLYNIWSCRDTPREDPPHLVSECTDAESAADRPIAVDIFFPTYDEDPELVRLSILDAKACEYPHDIDIQIHVLDDGKREEMAAVAAAEGVNYLTRSSNEGFKAGNLRNAMEVTSGDFIVICDADTRPFPTLLKHTLGYFRDPDVAWVQTPQWFFDLPRGRSLDQVLGKTLGSFGRTLGKGIQRLTGEIVIGRDPFVNDPQMFYDVIQRRRNRKGASFCCGAGSIHRRDAVMEAALKSYGNQVAKDVDQVVGEIDDAEIAGDLGEMVRTQAALEIEMTPYKFHVSEDIYTSIVLHSDPDRNWKSVFHPHVESKMLSPQDLQTWTVQRFKYAGGALDIAFHDNPLVGSKMSFGKKLFYASTFFSNLGCVWNTIFLVAPIIFLFTGIAPVAAYSFDFFNHFLPFIILMEISMMLGTWGVAGFKGKASYLAFFPVGLRALWTVIRGQQIKFPATPKERQEGNFVHLVWPQALMMLLTAVAILWGFYRIFIQGESGALSGLVSNTFWAANNLIILSGTVLAAFWKPQDEDPSSEQADSNPDVRGVEALTS